MDRDKDLLGAPERRALNNRLEFRESDDDDTLILEGYASVFNAPYDIYGGPENGGWSEVVDPRAFDTTLRSKPDLHLLINHEGMPLARTKSGTLQLSVDHVGLKVRAVLDKCDPDVQRLERKMKRGDMDEMSFGFRTVRQEWDDGYENRRLTEVNIDHGDVSIVNFGANPATSAQLNSATDALEFLASADLAELRSADNEKVIKALDVLKRAAGEDHSEHIHWSPATSMPVFIAEEAGMTLSAMHRAQGEILSLDEMLCDQG